MLLKIRKNDEVLITKGKEKGKVGKVLKVLRAKKSDKNQTPRVLVQGINMIKKHQKPTQDNQEGGIMTKEAPLALANVAYIASRTKNKIITSKIGFVIEEGKKRRIIKKFNKVIKE